MMAISQGCCTTRGTFLCSAVWAGLALALTMTLSFATSWVPGAKHPQYRNVVAAEEEGQFRPAPGYEWVNPDGPIGPVRWRPGAKHPDYANVLAAQKEGQFRPADGYEWDTPGKFGPVHRVGEKGKAGPVAKTPAGEPSKRHQPSASLTQDSRAERFRRYLSSRGALVDVRKMEPGLASYIAEGVTPLLSCGLQDVKANPPVARSDTLNFFGVAFKHPADSFCNGCPDANSCYLLADNCISLGSSVFCDVRYLNRLYHIALAALSYAWSGVKDGQRDRTGKIYLTPIRTVGLTDLARLQADTRAGRSTDFKKLEDFPFIFAMDELGQSKFLQVLVNTVYNLVLSHELAHIEQEMCRQAHYSETSRHRDWAKVYNTITCRQVGSSTDSELRADLRAIDMTKHFFDRDLQTLAREGGGFSKDLGKMKREFESLVPIAREVVLLAVIYSLEYELLVHLDPEGGLEMLRKTPSPPIKPAEFLEYFIRAGHKSGVYVGKDHMEPSLRALFLIDALDAGKLGKLNPGVTVADPGYRLMPFIIGRLQRIQTENCGRPDDDFMPYLLNYVQTIFGRN